MNRNLRRAKVRRIGLLLVGKVARNECSKDELMLVNQVVFGFFEE